MMIYVMQKKMKDVIGKEDAEKLNVKVVLIVKAGLEDFLIYVLIMNVLLIVVLGMGVIIKVMETVLIYLVFVKL